MGRIHDLSTRVVRAPRHIKYLATALVLLHIWLYWHNPRYHHLLSPSSWFHIRVVPRGIPLEYYHDPPSPPMPKERANAALVMVAHNYDLDAVMESMKFVEDRFNKRFRYPWVFLSEVPFSKQFRRATREITDANVTFGFIEPEEWNQPSWIDEDRAETARKQMERMRVLHAKSVPYRNLCRFHSGFLFNNKYLRDYRWYWRVEPGVEFYCDVTEDPFLFMQDNHKVYSFVLSMYEYPQTIATLWDTVTNFTKAHPQYVAPDNALRFISRDAGNTYNLCHFWNNFAIVDMEFLRSEAYARYFEHLEDAGGFYYERWSDAPVHTIAAALLANRSQLHFFGDVGYRHEPYQHCPQGAAHARGKCICVEKDTFDNSRSWQPPLTCHNNNCTPGADSVGQSVFTGRRQGTPVQILSDATVGLADLFDGDRRWSFV